jgi:hypothetical protein
MPLKRSFRYIFRGFQAGEEQTGKDFPYVFDRFRPRLGAEQERQV